MRLDTDFGAQHAAALRETGLAHLSLNCRADLTIVTEHFEWLTNLPDKEKEPWVIRINESTPPAMVEWLHMHGFHEGQGDLGLVRRGGLKNGKMEDFKWILHVKKGYREIVAGQGGYHGRGKIFLDACERILEANFNLWSIANSHLGVTQEEPEGVLRFICYDPVSSVNDIVAKAHWDRNSGTTHLWESHKGLWVPKSDDYRAEEPEMRLLDRAFEDQVHMFCSSKLGWYHPDKFPPVWHKGMSPAVGVHRMVIVYFHHHQFVDLPKEYSSHSRDPLAKRMREAKARPAAA